MASGSERTAISWKETEDVFNRAIDLPAEERASLLDAQEPQLRDVVEELIAGVQGAEAFIRDAVEKALLLRDRQGTELKAVALPFRLFFKPVEVRYPILGGRGGAIVHRCRRSAYSQTVNILKTLDLEASSDIQGGFRRPAGS